jgi:hypothetical protein
MRDIEHTDKARAVARALGEGWSLRPNPEDVNPHLDGPDGMALWLRWQRGRIEVNCSGHALSITVAAGTLPGDMARHIERRLLPEYRELHAAAQQRKREEDAEEARRDHVEAELLAALGKLGSTAPHAPRTVFMYGGWLRGNFEVRNGEVKINLHTNGPAAVAIARLLAELVAKMSPPPPS